MTKEATDIVSARVLKTPEQTAQDCVAVRKAEEACCKAVSEFASDLWNSEWKVKYLCIGTFNMIDEANDGLRCARAHLKEEYVTDDWSKLSEEERKNTSHIRRYE